MAQLSLSKAITNGGIMPVLKDESNVKMEDSDGVGMNSVSPKRNISSLRKISCMKS